MCSYCNNHDNPPVVRLPPAQDTSEAANDVQPQAPGSEFRPPMPGVVRQLLTELNTVREELSQLLAQDMKSHMMRGMPEKMGAYNPYPPITPESERRKSRIHELEKREGELMGEFDRLRKLYAAALEGGEPFRGDAVVVGADGGNAGGR